MCNVERVELSWHVLQQGQALEVSQHLKLRKKPTLKDLIRKNSKHVESAILIEGESIILDYNVVSTYRKLHSCSGEAAQRKGHGGC